MTSRSSTGYPQVQLLSSWQSECFKIRCFFWLVVRVLVMKPVFPEFLEPMMASIAKEPFNHPDWIFETKLDGYRAIAVIDSTGNPRICSPNHLPLEPKFPTVQEAV